MQGRRPPSFLAKKKNPAPAEEEDGRMMPAASAVEIYSCIASCSGAESEKSLPLGSMDSEVSAGLGAEGRDSLMGHRRGGELV